MLRLTGRRAGLALMYHSVAVRGGDPDAELVPPHGAALFEGQLRHAKRHYRIVRAEDLRDAVARRRRGDRFPLAITFDDDLACHAEIALPILRRVGTTATFFLSGASLERPYAFWFERLQRAYDERIPGLDSLVTGSPDAGTRSAIHPLCVLIEEMEPDARDAAADRLGTALGDDPPDSGIRSSQVRELVDAGMTIGFHTRRHDRLTALTDEQLRAALENGVDVLGSVAGSPLRTIGYPHGRADERVARAARRAGFTAGFTTRHTAVTPESDPLLQGRVGPSLRSVGAMAVLLVLTLLKSGSGRSSSAPPARAS
jgi:peptidoglycan/xylan/chitin deacetylase (PgdA/CDA1 family)